MTAKTAGNSQIPKYHVLRILTMIYFMTEDQYWKRACYQQTGGPQEFAVLCSLFRPLQNAMSV